MLDYWAPDSVAPAGVACKIVGEVEGKGLASLDNVSI
jgi:hypothetical protein